MISYDAGITHSTFNTLSFGNNMKTLIIIACKNPENMLLYKQQTIAKIVATIWQIYVNRWQTIINAFSV